MSDIPIHVTPPTESPSGPDLADEIGRAISNLMGANSPGTTHTLQPFINPRLPPSPDDPEIAALVSRMVESRLEEARVQRTSEAINWRAQEASLINKEIMAQKAIEELRAQLAAAEQRTAMQPEAVPSNIRANIPHKRRRNSTATVPDMFSTPARSTHSTHRAATLQSLQPISTQAIPIVMSDPQSMDVVPSDLQPSLPILEESMPLNPTPFSKQVADTASLIAVVPPQSPPADPEMQRTRPTCVPRYRHSTQPSATGPAHPPVDILHLGASPAPASVETSHTAASRTHPTRPPAPATQTTRRSVPRTVVKSAGEIYQYLPQDMPPDIDGLKKALDVHIRILWALLDSKAVPKDPPSQILNSFNLQFSNFLQLQASQDSGPELIPLHLVQVGTLMSSFKGGIARQARLVEEHMLQYIQVCLARLGFDRWCPDLHQMPYSLYNAACRIVALDTFKQALACSTYQHLQPNVSYIQNLDVLTKLYNHFLAEACLAFLTENGYPQQYHDLIDPKATSDDEPAEGGKIWFIKRRPERSIEAERFIQILDKKREEYVRQSKSRQWWECTRIVPAVQRDTDLLVLPEHMPIDYFDPEFFNQLQPRTRNHVAVPKIAFLPNVENSLTWCSDERLQDETFTHRYGRPVFDKYNMVSDADVLHAFASASDSDRDDDDSLGDDEGEGDWIYDDEPRSTNEEGMEEEEEEEEGEGEEEEVYDGSQDMSISAESHA